MALIFISSAGAVPSLKELPIPSPDKVAHFIVYGALGFLLCRAARRGLGWSWPRAILFAIAVSSAYGASDEWHQSFVKTRSVEVADWVADTLGAAFAQIPAYTFYRKRP